MVFGKLIDSNVDVDMLVKTRKQKESAGNKDNIQNSNNAFKCMTKIQHSQTS